MEMNASSLTAGAQQDEPPFDLFSCTEQELLRYCFNIVRPLNSKPILKEWKLQGGGPGGRGLNCQISK